MPFDRATRCCFFSRLRTKLGAAVCVAALTGCGPKISPPETYPVTGRVVASEGQVPPGVSVEFLPSDTEFRALGFVDADGNFSLNVIFGDRKLTGAIPGPHRVSLVFPLDAGRNGGQRLTLVKELVVEPKENQFTITLDKDSVIKERQ